MYHDFCKQDWAYVLFMVYGLSARFVTDLWWCTLYDKIHFGDVETSGRDVCGDQNLVLPLAETFQHHLTLVLRDIAVEHVRLLLDGGADCQLVRVPLGLAEHHGAPVVAAIHLDDVTYGPSAFVVAALNG